MYHVEGVQIEIDSIELLPFSSISRADVRRSGEPDRESLAIAPRMRVRLPTTRWYIASTFTSCADEARTAVLVAWFKAGAELIARAPAIQRRVVRPTGGRQVPSVQRRELRADRGAAWCHVRGAPGRARRGAAHSGAVEHVEHRGPCDEAVEHVLLGEPDRAHDLKAVLGGEPARTPGEALGRRGRERRICALRPVPALVGDHLRRTERDEHVGQPVFRRLEGADGLAELHRACRRTPTPSSTSSTRGRRARTRSPAGRPPPPPRASRRPDRVTWRARCHGRVPSPSDGSIPSIRAISRLSAVSVATAAPPSRAARSAIRFGAGPRSAMPSTDHLLTVDPRCQRRPGRRVHPGGAVELGEAPARVGAQRVDRNVVDAPRCAPGARPPQRNTIGTAAASVREQDVAPAARPRARPCSRRRWPARARRAPCGRTGRRVSWSSVIAGQPLGRPSTRSARIVRWISTEPP